MSRLLKLLEKLGRKRVVMDRQSNEPYLERYYLFLKDRNRFPFNVFLHKFLKSDPDDLHDHPWPYATLILKGGYYEWIPIYNQQGRKLCEVAVWRGPGHFRISSANSFHRIELDPEVTCWTLFMPGPQKREWGFATRSGWIQHEQYIESRKNG
jgi:hypothetical protein|tara:strand:+ start:199 stop:657 length:459 start_codon:yes stop_codon:yes gene_type:complete